MRLGAPWRQRTQIDAPRGTWLARWLVMMRTQLRPGVAVMAAAVMTGGLVACSRPASQPSVIGPALGESTAPGPVNPTNPPPDAAGGEVSVRLQGRPRPVATPAPAGAAPVTPEPASPPVVVTPGVVTGPAPVGAVGGSGVASPGGPGVGAAGPNGPGTGNGPPTPGPGQTSPPPRPDNGPGTGNTPIAPQQPVPAPSVPPATPPPAAPVTPQPTPPPATPPPAPAPTPTPTPRPQGSTPGGGQR